ncbi:BMP family ABC transporter substrate-binding protein [Bacillus solimangrovi]|uniref:BMP family ABC transporter substrate-binding protein n=1 Tax=Bacillus solimangrovi TaxID=1305675 RepID=A0A1E5LC67_9BACI|nr:BMP family ABC transporter substrate-binding protein [Bacillus solimangrovi]OEH91685.1 BMP family ABC transporter substrate-binding protein [Bacillus solimangrovi]
MKTILLSIITGISFMLLLVGCSSESINSNSVKVGMLVPETINEPVWGDKGYKGLLKIQSDLGVDVYYKENIKTIAMAEKAIKEFQEKGVSLVFGHGIEYGPIFIAFQDKYPDIQFVYFNGDETADNVVSIKFNSHAMGFFGGMVAAKMSKTNHIGVIAAFEWQPEIQGFVAGAKYEKPDIKVSIDYTYDWAGTDEAIYYLDELIKERADVFYPAGDMFNIPIINKVKDQGLYAIGFISEQSDLGEATVLTSTIQHVSYVYKDVAEKYMTEKLESGVILVDFQDGAISMGQFSPEVPEDYQLKLKDMIEHYKLMQQLPNE